MGNWDLRPEYCSVAEVIFNHEFTSNLAGLHTVSSPGPDMSTAHSLCANKLIRGSLRCFRFDELALGSPIYAHHRAQAFAGRLE